MAMFKTPHRVGCKCQRQVNVAMLILGKTTSNSFVSILARYSISNELDSILISRGCEVGTAIVGVEVGHAV